MKLSPVAAEISAWRVDISNKSPLLIVVILAVVAMLPAAAAAAPARERTSLNADWRFQKGDPPGTQGQLDYEKIKDQIKATGQEFVTQGPAANANQPVNNPGENISYTRQNFDDRSWRQLNLPHDWGIEGPFTQEYPGETGKLEWWGVAWYRKHFKVPASDKGRQLYLDVDGAMSHAVVWLNGKFVGGWPYGYASFELNLTPFIEYGKENVLAIRLDNPPDSSRWYPGGGIYRNVWLVKTSAIHVSHWGTYVTTPLVAAATATVEVKARISNEAADAAAVMVKTEIYELGPDELKIGKTIATATSSTLKIGGRADATIASQIEIPKPKLWNLQNPNLYVAVTSVEHDARLVDVYETVFGIRTIRFDANAGFFLNGEHVRIQGVCDHHDLGPLGAALNLRALQRQLEILKEMGVNAIRTSHNPPAPELLDLADRMGFLVMDEAFDCWRRAKKQNDYHLLFDDWHEKDWRAQLRRDRNHPSIILWSTGNEISEQRTPEGQRIAQELVGIAHQEDPTRPATAACNYTEAGYNGFQKIVDVFGYNYKPAEYPNFREKNPAVPLFASETASTVSSRGEYFFPVVEDKSQGRADFQVSSYDLYAPRWAWPPDVEFKGLDGTPAVAGEFVWTGFDYLGEPTPYGGDASTMLNFTNPSQQQQALKQLKEFGKIKVPSRSSYFGIVDLDGFKKDRFYVYQARWRPDLPMAHILPHWNWPDRVGQITPVHVYTSGDEAELFLNGRSLGRKHRGPYEYRLRWDEVRYEPGVLRVVAYKNGKHWAEDVMKTTGSATQLLINADRSIIKADGNDLSFVTVTIADKEGWLVPRSQNRVRCEVSGAGEIVAVDNGDATDHESFQARERSAYNGLLLVIVRARKEERGPIKLVVRSSGLPQKELVIQAR